MSGEEKKEAMRQRMAAARAARGKRPRRAPSAFSLLTPRQRLFVLEYLATSNGTQSAIKAGYGRAGADVTAHNLLVHVRVRAALEEQLKAKLASKEQVLDRIQAHALGANLLEHVGPDGRMTEEQFGALKRVGFLVKSYQANQDGTVTVELHAPHPFLAMLAKHHALLVERSEVSGPGGGPVEHKVDLKAGVDAAILAAVAPKESK